MDDTRDTGMHPLDYLMVLRRRIRWFVVPMAVCLVVGVLLTFLWPVKYRSAATVAISGGSVSSDLSRPIDRDERYRAFSQHLTSPATLSKVAVQERLTPGTPTEADVLALRQRIQIGLGDQVPGTEPGQVDTYVISYSDSTAERAHRVAQKLAEAFVEETQVSKTRRFEDTSEFLAAQLRDRKEALDRLDAKLTAAKARNMGRLPEQSTANEQALAALRQQLDTTTTQMRGEQDRLSYTEQQIAMFTQESNTLAPNQAPSTPQQRVIALQRALAEARMKYTEKNPEVQDLEDQLKRAQQDAAAERQLPVEDRVAVLKQNPAYQSLLSSRDQIKLHLRDLERTIGQVNGQIRWYQGRLEGAPLVAQEMQSIQRDYDLEKKNYDDLSNRYQSAKLNEELERKQGSEHFRILYPATWPIAPYEPNRLRMLLLTVGAALFLGVGSAIGREYLDQSVHDARTLQHQFDVPVLGEIPHIDKAA